MSDFRNLQLIYDSYDAWQSGPNQTRFATGQQSNVSMASTAGTLPVQGPGGKVNQYAMNATNSSTMPAEMEEDQFDETALIQKKEFLKLIDELEIKSRQRSMTFATDLLQELKDRVIKL